MSEILGKGAPPKSFRSRNGASRLAMEEVVESACRIFPASIGSRETLSNEAYYHEVFTMKLLPWVFFTIKSQTFLGVSSKKNPIAPQFLFDPSMVLTSWLICLRGWMTKRDPFVSGNK